MRREEEREIVARRRRRRGTGSMLGRVQQERGLQTGWLFSIVDCWELRCPVAVSLLSCSRLSGDKSLYFCCPRWTEKSRPHSKALLPVTKYKQSSTSSHQVQAVKYK